MLCGGENNIRNACTAQNVPKDKIDACVGFVRKASADELKRTKQCSADKDCFTIVDHANNSPIPSQNWPARFARNVRQFKCQGYPTELLPLVEATIDVKVKDGQAIYKVVGKEKFVGGSYNPSGWNFCNWLVAVIQGKSPQQEIRIELAPIAHLAEIWEGAVEPGRVGVALLWSPDVVRYEIWGHDRYPDNQCTPMSDPHRIWSVKKAENSGLKPLLTIESAKALGKICEKEQSIVCLCNNLEERAAQGMRILAGEDFSAIRQKALNAAKK